MSLKQTSSPEFRLAVGKVLERQRKHLKIHQHELARFAGVRQSTICSYEAGAVAPGITVLFRLMKVLKIDVAELMALLPLEEIQRNPRPAASALATWAKAGKITSCLVQRVRRGKPCNCGEHV